MFASKSTKLMKTLQLNSRHEP
ncbi:unnamed protein product [Ectocarpus sp. CCAP 1310/34]|nr:unnamed protein product [Ectocarpus sp. CCAP 1310/34]